MISRSSFFKLLKEDVRQRLWTIVLAAIVFILPVPIYIAMEISGSREFGTGLLDNFARNLAEPMARNSVWLVLVTIVGALICAVSGFGYLFSKKKVDFFHSLPVKRETLFAVRYINGVLIYLVPYLAMVLVSVLIIAFTGNMRAVVFSIVLKGLAVHLLGYLAIYTTCILCVVFVGNIVVFFAVSGWVFGITPITLLVFNWFEETFFNTYSYLGDSFNEWLYSLRFLFPGYFYIYSVDASGLAVSTVSLLLQELAFVVVLTVITLLVYRARPSDGAGKAIAFAVLKPVIRVSVELLAGALMGMMFYSMADRSTGVPGWMMFGVVLGVVLSHMLIQSIFHFDIRKCFAGKWSMGVCAVVTVLFVLVMRYDTFGYDKYLPKEKKIESVAVEVTGLDRYRNNFTYTGSSIIWTEELEEMELTNVPAVYPYLESLVSDNEAYWDLRENGRTSDFTRVNVAYRLENGKTVYREYRANGLREDLFTPIFESMEYKEAHYSDIYTIPDSFVTSITAVHAMNELQMNLSPAEGAEFMATLRRELSAQTLKEKIETLPVAVLNMKIVERTPRYDSDGMPVDHSYDYTTELPVYPSFTETLRFMRERGFAATGEYEWTGKEMMRLELPEIAIKEPELYTGEVYTKDASVELTEYVKVGIGEQFGDVKIAYPEDWDYGYNTIPVEPEDYERLYALCTWEELYYYGRPGFERYENYRVCLDVPRDGYNIYETYCFIVPQDADLSFLFE